jgi:hypothetical protein
VTHQPQGADTPETWDSCIYPELGTLHAFRPPDRPVRQDCCPHTEGRWVGLEHGWTVEEHRFPLSPVRCLCSSSSIPTGVLLCVSPGDPARKENSVSVLVWKTPCLLLRLQLRLPGSSLPFFHLMGAIRFWTPTNKDIQCVCSDELIERPHCARCSPGYWGARELTCGTW